MKLKSIWFVIKEAVGEFATGPALGLSAATAYYAVFSIAPLLVLVVGLAGLVFGEGKVLSEIHRQLGSYLGPKATHLLESMMRAQLKSSSLMASIIGAVALVFGATAVFGQLQESLNTIWGVAAKPGYSFWLYVRDRLLSLAMLLGIGFLLLVSMALTTFVNAFTHYISAEISFPNWLVPSLEGVVSFLVTALLFGSILKILPDVRIGWRDVAVGALVTALLFTAGKFLLGLYLSHEIGASAYGAGSAFVVILLYVYYASIIVYLGAEFTKAYTRCRGARPRPSRYAIAVTPGRVKSPVSGSARHKRGRSTQPHHLHQR